MAAVGTDVNADVEAVADVTSLTQDDLQLVFESLPFAEDKSRAMRVCADWRTAASAPYLWTSLVVQDGRKLCAADVHRLLALCNGRLARLELQKAPFLASSLQLLSDNPRLLHLDLTGCKNVVGTKLLMVLKHCSSLRSLSVDGCKLGRGHAVLRSFCSNLPAGVVLDVSACDECDLIRAPACECLACEGEFCIDCKDNFKLCEGCGKGTCSTCLEDEDADDLEQMIECRSCDKFVHMECTGMATFFNCSTCYLSVCLDCMGKNPVIFCAECSDSVCLDCIGSPGGKVLLFCDGCHESVCLDCIGKKPVLHCDECSDSVCLDCMDKKPRIFCCDCYICVCVDCWSSGKKVMVPKSGDYTEMQCLSCAV